MKVLGRILDTKLDPLMGSTGWCMLDGDCCFVCAMDGNSLTSLDVFNPAAMSVLQALTDPILGRLTGCEGIAIRGNYCHVGGYTSDRFTVVDKTDPSNMSIVASLQDAELLDGACTIDNFGDYDFVGAYNKHRLTVVRVNDPLNPVIVGNNFQDVVNLRNPTYVKCSRSGQYLFVTARGSDKFVTMSISNPLDISIAGSCPCGLRISGMCLSADEKLAYVADSQGNSLIVVDIEVPTAPSVLGTTAAVIPWALVPACVSGTRFILVTSYNGDEVAVVDAYDPANPFVVEFLQDAALLNGADDIKYRNGVAFVTLNAGGGLTSVSLKPRHVVTAKKCGSYSMRRCVSRSKVIT